MQNKFILFIFIAIFLTACGAQSAPVLPVPSDNEVEPTPLPPTSAPTATQAPISTPTDLFGSVSSEEAQTGLMLEPIVSQILELELQKRLEAGEIEDFQVESLGVYPKGDGTLYAEVFYRVKTGKTFWLEDGGTPGEDGWVTGKCVRFDFLITPEAYQLKNKRLCS